MYLLIFNSTILYLIPIHLQNLNFDKEMVLGGMHGLKNMKIMDMDLTDSDEKQAVAKMKACVKNPSIVTIHPVGNVRMKAYFGDTKQVISKLSGMVALNVANNDISDIACRKIAPYGFNLLNMQGALASVDESPDMALLISNFISGKSTSLVVKGEPENASNILLFDAAMQKFHVPTLLDGLDTPMLRALNFHSMHLLPIEDKMMASNHVGMEFKSNVLACSPLGPKAPLNISSISMHATLYDATNTTLGTLQVMDFDVVHGRLLECSNLTIHAKNVIMMLNDDGKPFGKFIKDTMTSSSIEMKLVGSSNATTIAGSLGEMRLKHIPVAFDVVLTGMKHLSNVTIQSFELTRDTDKGELLSTTAEIWNPSVFSIPLKNVQMHLGIPPHKRNLDRSVENIGYLRVPELALNPGSNLQTMEGELHPLLTRGKLSLLVNTFFSQYMRNENSNLLVTISSIDSNSAWLKNAIQGFQMATTMTGVGAKYKLMDDLKMVEMQVEFRDAPPNSPINGVMKMKSKISAKAQLPSNFKIGLDIKAIERMKLQILNSKNKSSGVLLTGHENCTFDQQTKFLSLNMSHEYQISMDPIMASGMASFVSDLVLQSSKDQIPMTLTSKNILNAGVNPVVTTHMGDIYLTALPLDATLFLSGMNRFSDKAIEIRKMDIVKGNKTMMLLATEIVIYNPSVVSTSLGNIRLEIKYKSAVLGVVHIDELNVQCCNKPNIVKAIVAFQPATSDIQVSEVFLSNFISGYYLRNNKNGQQVGLHGMQTSTTYSVLQPALSKFYSVSWIPNLPIFFPNTPTLVLSALMYLPSILHPTQIATTLAMANPFSTEFKVLTVDFKMVPCKVVNLADPMKCSEYFKTPLASFAPANLPTIQVDAKTRKCYSCCQGTDCSRSNDEFPLCPNATIGTCATAQVLSIFSAETLAALMHTLSKDGLLVSVNGSMKVAIGEYETALMYQQSNLLVKLSH